ncbi:MAG: DNA primase catalytic subunit PriS [Candidatus Micrarchaeota archaeon]|nr:DNA primase catalytic subunit PriS [Candidatus Micrarchaeota archaeon]
MSDIGNKTVTEYIRDYYKSATGAAPDRIEQREFGFGSFASRIAVRHTSFKNERELHSYLVDTAPLHVDYSAAYYKNPDAPMDRKEWLGSELRFDIDAGDIVKLPCRIEHGKEWACEKCLDAAKEEVIKLVENFLVPDFGFSERELEINFSGNRGYHVHIRKESVLSLNKSAREEISNYIFGQEPDYNSFFYTVKIDPRHEKQMGPGPGDGGWRGKVAKAFLDAASSKEDLTSLGIDKVTASWIFKNIVKVREQISQGNWDFVRIPNRESVFGNLLSRQVINQGNRIDKGVTNDPSHLMRLPNTIHGGTGLIAKKVPSLAALEIFDPMKGALAFKTGELRVRADSRYRLAINGREFGPYKNEELELPAYAATYLYLKGLADIISNK